jgi:hypothetical protein
LRLPACQRILGASPATALLDRNSGRLDRNSGRFAAAAFTCHVLSFCCDGALAQPWLARGDIQLRHDVERLADEGIVDSPVSTWPLSWPELARDVWRAEVGCARTAEVDQALQRLQRAARRAAEPGFSGFGARVAATDGPEARRDFADSLRSKGELAASPVWLGQRAAANFEVAVASKDARTHGLSELTDRMWA